MREHIIVGLLLVAATVTVAWSSAALYHKAEHAIARMNECVRDQQASGYTKHEAQQHCASAQQ